VITAAALCPAPPLLARELTGRDPVIPELRALCAEVTQQLVRTDPATIAVIGAAEHTRAWDGASTLDLGSFAPGFGWPPGTPGLPVALGLGARLLDQAGYAGHRILQAVGQHEPPGGCRELGAELGAAGERIALLVMADGSARRGRRAPGHLDERSADLDAEVERAVRAGDLGALAAVDPALARELMAAGRPAWQVLAGALAAEPGWPARPRVDVRYSGDPFGVAYLVAEFRPG